ncbi:HNH endonuclease signature motif containing protein [Chamaesiphon sp. VAR_69_metabat_338]|uniref:HNH endonuclease n=1 Tax=Chamaesiphon sp. VAR_69_metabat_338 TaxID=2964704 RepID=UPI00286DC607|nr:HNH endonuclease signature motif containing protein [Chamaesiphon sp. VAR_69_metabat_338]
MTEITAQQKELITQRARGYCEYCWSQVKYSPDPFSIEHIIPLSKGGTYDLDNLALACQGCNNRKYNHIEAIDPIDGNFVQLYHPRQQLRSEHFIWSDDFTELIGISPTGRATIVRLQLNREGVVNLRRVLNMVNLHPPN